MESEFKKLSNKRKIEKEVHLYAIDGYQKMADGEDIYILGWGLLMQKILLMSERLKTEKDRDSKLISLKVPGDENRLRSGKNYVIFTDNLKEPSLYR
jgi:transketolase C-terminal domain/subunit